jgi:hypothetical protein
MAAAIMVPAAAFQAPQPGVGSGGGFEIFHAHQFPFAGVTPIGGARRGPLTLLSKIVLVNNNYINMNSIDGSGR